MSTKTVLFPPPSRGSNLTQPELKWLFSVQNLLPLITVDTSGGAVAIPLPVAGGNAQVGQSNQNQEIIYKKMSADTNVCTITGAIDGPVTLTAQYAFARFKSDGTNWWRVG